MRMHSLLPRGRAIGVLVLSAGIVVTPSLALATDSSTNPTPPLVTIPLASAQAFTTTSASNPACPAGGGPTSTPSVTPTVLGVTFETPPPTTTAAKPGGRLPFTGLPLVQSAVVGFALIASGSVLVYSRRRHRQGHFVHDSHARG